MSTLTCNDFLKVFNFYKKEAEKCENNKLYLSACVLYGAALEAALFSFFLIDFDEDDPSHPSNEDLRYTWLNELIQAAADAGIIKGSIAKDIANFRHLVHPYRYCGRLKTKKHNVTKREHDMVKKKFFKIMNQLADKILDDIDPEELLNL